LHFSQQSFLKSKSTTNLVTDFDFIFPIVSSQCQYDSIYSDFSRAFDFLYHVSLHIVLVPVLGMLICDPLSHQLFTQSAFAICLFVIF